MKVIISETGEIHGRGSQQWKWVSHLTDEERHAVRNGGIVLIKDWLVSPQNCGWKRVEFRGGQYYHREATPEEVRAAEGK